MNGLKDHQIAGLVNKVSEDLDNRIGNLPQCLRSIVCKAVMDYILENELDLDNKKREPD